jgi:hypothetical protein
MEVGKTYTITTTGSGMGSGMDICYVYQLTENNTIKFVARLNNFITFVEMPIGNVSGVETTHNEEFASAARALGYK